ncbi:hypothetical protein M758_9G152700 [Ceratodon purpureus]|nr:hypothetical protein M758_9G152700 [Ceratodon purpureus]
MFLSMLSMLLSMLLFWRLQRSRLRFLLLRFNLLRFSYNLFPFLPLRIPKIHLNMAILSNFSKFSVVQGRAKNFDVLMEETSTTGGEIGTTTI